MNADNTHRKTERTEYYDHGTSKFVSPSLLRSRVLPPSGTCTAARYYRGVTKAVKIDRAYAVSAAAARDFNNELTVILSSLSESLESIEEDHPARVRLLDLQGAAQRCVWIAAALQQYSAQRGVRPSAALMESLIDE